MEGCRGPGWWQGRYGGAAEADDWVGGDEVAIKLGLRRLESAILSELRVVKNDRSIKLKEIMEWSTGKVKIEEGEELVYLPELKINVALKRAK